MNPSQQIATLLKEWLDLTRLESHAIQFSRWSELARVQQTKTELRQPLVDALERWKLVNRNEAAVNPFSGEIDRLLALETKNSQLLAMRKLEVREKILLIEQALYELRNFRSTYTPASQAA